MKKISEIQEVYFIGIGGIGMSALARYFKSLGKKVSGYDRTETELTKQLEEEGIEIHYEERLDLINRNADVVVYTPAVPAEHKELVYYRQHQYELLKRSDVLGIITESSFNICIAGTHGKTTTTTMVAHILRDSGYGCNAFLGGIAANYNSNFWSSERNVCVVEADEYDRSFLKLSPDMAVITAMDADHLDIYGTPSAVEDAFVAFSERIKKGGVLFSRFGLKRSGDLKGDKQYTYGLEDHNADVYATNVRNREGGYLYDVAGKGWELKDVKLMMGGLHNIENSVAAIAIANELGIPGEKIKEALVGFKGVKRRFEYILPVKDADSIVYVDDYAHHPEELRALITSAKSLFPERKCTVVFQPHLFTRTRDFADEFASVLSLADEVLLLPIYPAREPAIAGVDSTMLERKIAAGKAQTVSKEELMKVIGEKNTVEKGGLLITAGAGDIDKLVQPLRMLLEGSKR
ncbi:MAG: UDP-N-acetylmuramate--L-alanine ligase [Chitinophagaceae bacterium]|nr:UDP-N-acetylmuramate--L-alanine ligase [Chitinophagaceae bacterium]MCW5929109.1 UDP-N-acetylmuramate--L-alanine ligase [Chitinophagaceae bacterium]